MLSALPKYFLFQFGAVCNRTRGEPPVRPGLNDWQTTQDMMMIRLRIRDVLNGNQLIFKLLEMILWNKRGD